MLIIDDVDSLCARRDNSRSDVEIRVAASLIANIDSLVRFINSRVSLYSRLASYHS